MRNIRLNKFVVNSFNNFFVDFFWRVFYNAATKGLVIMTVAEGLKRFRAVRKLTQKDVATAVGIFPQAYQRYEAGKVLPIITVLIKLAKAYNVSIDYLVGLAEDTGNDSDIQDNEPSELQGVCGADEPPVDATIS